MRIFTQMDGDDLEDLRSLNGWWAIVRLLCATTVKEKGILLENADLEGIKGKVLMGPMAGAMAYKNDILITGSARVASRCKNYSTSPSSFHTPTHDIVKNSMVHANVVSYNHQENGALLNKGIIKSPSKPLFPKYQAQSSLREEDGNSSSPKRVHFVNTITIIKQEDGPKEAKSLELNAIESDNHDLDEKTMGNEAEISNIMVEKGEASDLRNNDKTSDLRRKFIANAYIDLDLPMNVMSLAYYNAIRNQGETILENVEANIDPSLSQVVFGRRFVETTKLTLDREKGLITFSNEIKEVTFKTPYRDSKMDGLTSDGHDLLSSRVILGDDDFRRGCNDNRLEQGSAHKSVIVRVSHDLRGIPGSQTFMGAWSTVACDYCWQKGNFMYVVDDEDLSFFPCEPSPAFGTNSPFVSINNEPPLMEAEPLDVENSEQIVESTVDSRGSPPREEMLVVSSKSITERMKSRKCRTKGSTKPPVKRSLVQAGSSSRATRQKTSPSKIKGEREVLNEREKARDKECEELKAKCEVAMADFDNNQAVNVLRQKIMSLSGE
ncbi:hypothetical protein Tco_0031538 [Tanacetum coccineum]